MNTFSLKKQLIGYRAYLKEKSLKKDRSFVGSGKDFLEGLLTFPGFLLEKMSAFFAPAMIVVTVFFHFRLSSVYANSSYDFTRDLMEGWKVFRNMAYLLFIFQIPFSGLSDLVYFLRGKFDKVGRWISTWTRSMLLVTFSYAIAGLVVDFIFVCVFMYAAVTNQSADAVILFFEKVMY